MKLQNYDAKSGKYVLELSRDEMDMLHNLADGVAETYKLQDDGLLGLTEQQVCHLRDALEQVIEDRLGMTDSTACNQTI